MSGLRLSNGMPGKLASNSFITDQAFSMLFTVQNCRSLPTLRNLAPIGIAEAVANVA